jgi:hypothetical protein
MANEFTNQQIAVLTREAEATYFAPYYDEEDEETFDFNGSSDTYFDYDDYEYQQSLYI